ncbi:hypothetical protein JNB11_01580 [Kocuria palustris]|nr:hypothetical protein [Kocuria palustris]
MQPSNDALLKVLVALVINQGLKDQEPDHRAQFHLGKFVESMETLRDKLNTEPRLVIDIRKMVACLRLFPGVEVNGDIIGVDCRDESNLHEFKRIVLDSVVEFATNSMPLDDLIDAGNSAIHTLSPNVDPNSELVDKTDKMEIIDAILVDEDKPTESEVKVIELVEDSNRVPVDDNNSGKPQDLDALVEVDEANVNDGAIEATSLTESLSSTNNEMQIDGEPSQTKSEDAHKDTIEAHDDSEKQLKTSTDSVKTEGLHETGESSAEPVDEGGENIVSSNLTETHESGEMNDDSDHVDEQKIEQTSQNAALPVNERPLTEAQEKEPEVVVNKEENDTPKPSKEKTKTEMLEDQPELQNEQSEAAKDAIGDIVMEPGKGDGVLLDEKESNEAEHNHSNIHTQDDEGQGHIDDESKVLVNDENLKDEAQISTADKVSEEKEDGHDSDSANPTEKPSSETVSSEDALTTLKSLDDSHMETTEGTNEEPESLLGKDIQDTVESNTNSPNLALDQLTTKSESEAKSKSPIEKDSEDATEAEDHKSSKVKVELKEPEIIPRRRKRTHEDEPGDLKTRKLVKLERRELTPAQYKRFQQVSINLITSIQAHRFSSPFLTPPKKADQSDYSLVVKHPIDLKLLLKLVKQKNPPVYTLVKQLQRDIMLMFANSVMYHKSDQDSLQLVHTMRHDVNESLPMFEEAEDEIRAE